ncbi:hypothetical protein JET76_21860 [Pseudomonas putida]|mgnify:CR=1 FL=1|uniref:hypothetical protein n=1 Tax=Pseudomonas putida TaxID=303 RepID=UPI000DB28836|nr:hypothetical protein [Pseudomonas putida]MBI6943980.1 hypothetical protein [Pseudomonas putida]MBI6959968.1 hypothetical protein [Pseudomonas putida]PZQ37103.1 MAG: hypothetical protein DI560_22485 [Pseudomonas putida]
MAKAADRTLFFYQGNQLVSVQDGDQHLAIFRNDTLPLAELSTDPTIGSALLATDTPGSVLAVQNSNVQAEESPST